MRFESDARRGDAGGSGALPTGVTVELPSIASAAFRAGAEALFSSGKAVSLSAMLAAGMASCASAGPLEVEHRNTVTLPATTTDQNGVAFTITGLSGVALVPGTRDRFIAVMDNSNKLVLLRLTIGDDGTIGGAEVIGGFSLAESRDFEGISCTDATRNTVLLAEEGVPSVREYSLETGELVRVLPTAGVYTNRRANFGFESLGAVWTESSPGRLSGELWTCNEEALTVDGALSSTNAGSVVRLQRYSLNGTQAAASYQVAYVTEPMHGGPISGSRSGVSEMVLLPDGRVLTLERSLAFSLEGFFRNRIYEVSLDGVTDVSGFAGLIGQTYTAATTANGRKRLLWSGDLSNLEGLTLGPKLSGDGRWSLVGIVDDADPLSVNRIEGFVVSGVERVPVRRWPRR